MKSIRMEVFQQRQEQSYEQRAIRILDVLQKELAFYEEAALTGRIESMEDTLEISDDTAMRDNAIWIGGEFCTGR